MGFRKQKVKLEHTLIAGLRPVLEELAHTPGVKRIIPGPIRPIRQPQPLTLSVRQTTPDGLRLLAKGGAAQEVYVVTSDAAQVVAFIEARYPRRSS